MKKVTKKQVQAFLKSHYIMQIATVSKKKIPRVSVLLYATDNDFNFYCATHSDSIKAKNMAVNKNVSLVVWEHNNLSVQVDGIVEIVTDQKEKLKIVDKLAKAATADKDFWPPVLRIGGDEYSVYKIVPSTIFALEIKSHSIRETVSPFTQIK